jgi:Protein NO VEIN, C-terminal
VAVSCGDGVGFVILSFDENDGAERFIEVQTTGLGKHFPIYVTANEVRCSEDCPEQFRLYRVFDFSRDPRVYVVGGYFPGSAGWCRLSTGHQFGSLESSWDAARLHAIASPEHPIELGRWHPARNPKGADVRATSAATSARLTRSRAVIYGRTADVADVF